MDGKFDSIMPPDELYGRTGIQRMIINTIYQLTAHMQNEPGDFERAKRLLMIPDYFHFLLAGECCSEYTNATTTQLVNAGTKDWDATLIKAAGIPETIFGKLHLPGGRLGKLRKGIADEVGFECDVVLPPTHDTASAVAALPISGNPEKAVWLSSGTWSLMGGETDAPFITSTSRKLNFTNEGGYGGKYCLLKNIMGLWMLQSVRRELAPDMSYDDVALASERAGIDTIVDCEDPKFLSPDSMTGAIAEYCNERGKRAPSGIAETAAVIYGSLAASYAENLSELREITGVDYTDFHILGGGSKDDYLNRLTARRAGMTVHAGPGEASAIGNIIVQMISDGVFADIAEARNCVRESFGIRSYEGGNGGG
jgi:rhamnulokinase